MVERICETGEFWAGVEETEGLMDGDKVIIQMMN